MYFQSCIEIILGYFSGLYGSTRDYFIANRYGSLIKSGNRTNQCQMQFALIKSANELFALRDLPLIAMALKTNLVLPLSLCNFKATNNITSVLL